MFLVELNLVYEVHGACRFSGVYKGHDFGAVSELPAGSTSFRVAGFSNKEPSLKTWPRRDFPKRSGGHFAHCPQLEVTQVAMLCLRLQYGSLYKLQHFGNSNLGKIPHALLLHSACEST